MRAKRVLVVDDDPDQREICVAILRHHQYEILEAADGEEAVRLVQAHRPDLVLLDGMLPRLDGWEVTQRLKHAPETAAIPILMVTARALDEDRARSTEAGVDGYLAKPCEPTRVLEEVQRFIGAATES